jgi:hypothetical protein
LIDLAVFTAVSRLASVGTVDAAVIATLFEAVVLAVLLVLVVLLVLGVLLALGAGIAVGAFANAVSAGRASPRSIDVAITAMRRRGVFTVGEASRVGIAR